MTAIERERADAMDVRCLDLCIGMLERVNGVRPAHPSHLLSINPIACLQTFEENSTLEGVLGELIVPAVKRKELILREKGLVCLGLCCLIARRMALNSFQLFLSQVQTAPEVLKLRVLQVVFDVLMVHEGDFLANASVGVRICRVYFLSSVKVLITVVTGWASDRVPAAGARK
jgi:condensin complex subunit 3